MVDTPMMNSTIKTTLLELKAGPPRSRGAMTVLPLFDPTPRMLNYVALSHALAAGTFKITEISEGGSVPSLMAINEGETHVLLLDSEEVEGAKQNRVFNSSILVSAKSKIRIPVSCTEQGRWGYRRPDFRPSGNVMPSRVRANKKAHVSDSLRSSESYAGDQGSVWDDVRACHMEMGTSSPTGAMKDAFDGRHADLDELIASFKPQPWQSGIAVSVDGQLVGFDYVSDSKAFAEVYPKLIRSYAMEALVPNREQRSRWRTRMSRFESNLLEQVRLLVNGPEPATESIHKSAGLGKDYRYSSRRLIGSALVHENEVVHMAFLPVDGRS